MKTYQTTPARQYDALLDETPAEALEAYFAPVSEVKQAKPAKPVYRINGRYASKSAFIAYCYGKLAILEALVTKLNRDLLKDISTKTFDAVLACLRKLYTAIDGLTAELARLDTV